MKFDTSENFDTTFLMQVRDEEWRILPSERKFISAPFVHRSDLSKKHCNQLSSTTIGILRKNCVSISSDFFNSGFKYYCTTVLKARVRELKFFEFISCGWTHVVWAKHSCLYHGFK